MIVYGDASYAEDASTLVAHMRTNLAVCTAAPTLDHLRALLIRVGQFEQAVADALLTVSFYEQAAVLTCLAAHAFYAAWRQEAGKHVNTVLQQLQHALDTLDVPDSRLMVKVPEGFAFYALFPDHYILVARRWLYDHAHSSPHDAVVIGVRSIGTTLSALLAAVLAEAGWRVTRMTVRPTGHPFERQVVLGDSHFGSDTWVLIVDEGPGMSGSSMAAVAEAVQQAGVDRRRIAFVPGHAGDPGSAAPDEVRRWWQTTLRYPAAAETLQIHGMTLAESLAATTALLCEDEVVHVEDVGGGLWRRVVYAYERDWPAVCAPFERPKYRVTLRSGRKVMWKFGGLAGAPGMSLSSAETEAETLNERAAAGWGPAPLGVAHGFVAVPWLEGTPLSHADMTPDLLAHIGRYIAMVSGPSLAPDEQNAALDGAGEMLYWNVWETLGEALAKRTRPLFGAARAAAEGHVFRSYGDGHLAPHEWLRMSDGRLEKVDSTGHVNDHTTVGRLPVAWDIAGAIVEWHLDKIQHIQLLDAYHMAGGEPFPAPLFTLYRLAYAAFRLGQTTMCVQMSGDAADQARLWQAAECYKALLADALNGAA